MRRFLQNHEVTRRLVVTDQGGNRVDADVDPTVTVRDGDGTDVVVDAATSAVTGETGLYEHTLDPLGNLDEYEEEWAVTVDGHDRVYTRHFETVQTRLASLGRLRSVIEEERTRAGVTTSLANDALQRFAWNVEDWFADALRWSPFVKASRVSLNLRGRRQSVPGRPYLRAVLGATAYTVAGRTVSTFDASDLRVRRNRLEHKGGGNMPRYYVDLHLEHGRPAPVDLSEAAAKFARYLAKRSDIPERATEYATEGAAFTLAMPSPGRPTGLPEVDGVLRRYRRPSL